MDWGADVVSVVTKVICMGPVAKRWEELKILSGTAWPLQAKALLVFLVVPVIH